MNFKLTILTVFVLATATYVSSKAVVKRQSDDDSLGSLAWQTLLSVIAPVAIGGISELFGSIFKPNIVKEQTIFGRPMKVTVCTEAEFCIQITDEWTGIVSTGTGASYKDAIGDCTRSIYEELLKDGQLSVYDLCDLHVSFPHPDTDNCSDVKINPCDLLHPVATTPKPCTDAHGRYCIKNQDRCNTPMFHDFMMENCYKTCTNGLCGASSDPCKLQ